jgi:hypothetical protein
LPTPPHGHSRSAADKIAASHVSVRRELARPRIDAAALPRRHYATIRRYAAADTPLTNIDYASRPQIIAFSSRRHERHAEEVFSFTIASAELIRQLLAEILPPTATD